MGKARITGGERPRVPGVYAAGATAACAALFVAALYLKTACPTTFWQDAGIYLRSAYLLGNCYPPGYPAYLCVSYLFAAFPGDAVSGLNVFSALAAAGAAAAFALLAWRLAPTARSAPVAAAVSTLVLFTTPAAWSQGTVAEVYTLNLAVTAFTLLSLVAWGGDADRRGLWLAAFLYGVGAGIHPMQVTFLPGFILYVLWAGRKTVISVKVVAGLAAAFVWGLSCYLYLPIRSAAGAAPDWGAPDVLKRFIEHAGGMKFRAGARFQWSLFLERGAVALSAFPSQVGWLGSAFGSAGLAWLAWKRRRETALLVLAGAGSALFILNYFSANWRAYYTPLYAAAALGAGCFAAWLIEKAGISRWIAAAVSAAVVIASAAAALSRFAPADRSRDFGAAAAASKLLEAVDYRGALLLSHAGGAVVGPLAGLYTATRARPDVRVVDASGDRQFDDFAELAGAPPGTRSELLDDAAYERAFLSLAADAGRPLHVLAVEPALMRYGFGLQKRHLVFRVTRPGERPLNRDWWGFYWRRGEPDADVSDYWNTTYYAAVYLTEARDREAAGDGERARYCRARAEHFAAGSAEAQTMIACAAAEAGDYARAETFLRRAIALDPAFATPRWQLIYVLEAAGDETAAAWERREYEKLFGGDDEVAR